MNHRLSRSYLDRRSCLVLLLLVLLAACGQTAPSSTPAGANLPGAPKLLPLSGPIRAAPGRLVFDRVNEFWTLRLSTAKTATLATFDGTVYPAAPAVSPDGTTIAYSLYTPGQGVDDPAYGIDLYVMNADGTAPQLVLAHEGPGDVLTEPAWAADGRTLYFTHRMSAGTAQIERVARDGSGRAVVVEQAASPTLSADGQLLAYLATDPATTRTQLVVAQADGSNARPIVTADQFQLLAAPRFAPTGAAIAFAAVRAGPGPSPAQARGDLLAWLRPRMAAAHGTPWEIQVVNADGMGLRQLTDLQEDGPLPTWSPDGAWIAFKGELGIYMVDAAGTETRRISDEVVSSIAWLAE